MIPPHSMPPERRSALDDVHYAREEQDSEFGGAAHNDGHTPAEWVAMTVKQIGKAVAHCGSHPDGGASGEYRKRLVMAAALLVAAVESYDRVGVVKL